MKNKIRFIIIRHKETNQIWAAELLVQDQENDIFLSQCVESKDYAAEKEFEENFFGWQNDRYLQSTDRFLVEQVEKEVELV